MDITATAGPGAGHGVVTMAGELDIHTAPDLRQALAAAVAVYEETVVDLARLGFCDCAGLGALIAARNAARRHGTRLHLRNIPSHLQRLARATSTSLATLDTSSGGAMVSPRRAGARPAHRAVG